MASEVKRRGPRQSAEERRDAVVEAAIAEFAARGLHGASTEAIAERAGISQPYIFRLFGTKKELFIAVAERICDRIVEAFRNAAAADPADAFHAMGHAFVELLAHREEFLVLLQAFAACDDGEVREVMRGRIGQIYHHVEGLSGADETAIQQFIAHGMLLMVTTALDVPALAGTEDWAGKLLTVKDHAHDHC